MTVRASGKAHAEAAGNPAGPRGWGHTGRAFPAEDEFQARWTRADARRIGSLSDPAVARGQNSLPTHLVMPTLPIDFPDMSDRKLWVWDTWPLTDSRSNQIGHLGWDVIFSLIAPRQVDFDDRHRYARLGYFFRRTGETVRPVNGGWIFGGTVFPRGAPASIFEEQSFSHLAEWSGSARIFGGDTVGIFYTPVAYYRDGVDGRRLDSRIAMSEGRIRADRHRLWFEGFDVHREIVRPDGRHYQTVAQCSRVNFRDPFTFEDPARPGTTFMVFEANSGGRPEERECSPGDLGYAPGDPEAETPEEVLGSGAGHHAANIGLAVAENADLTEWALLPPLLRADFVTDQIERPQMYVQDGRYYLFGVSHGATFASGIAAPEGLYGWVGEGLRSDYIPLNSGSGLVLGNPTDLNSPLGSPRQPHPEQHSHAFQTYAHYVMPGGLVQSFIDSIATPGGVLRGGTLAPTVRIRIEGDQTSLDRQYGHDGLGPFAHIPSTSAP